MSDVLSQLCDEAADWARRTGVRQRIRWLRDQGRLEACSTDFGDGFCCGERPYTGWVWVIEGWPKDGGGGK